ncbi:hypothetical protein EVAR_23201_1 [Eumeta japonica]|uniref:Uncharacterized protein n=1 Tax=Eumeta variegata TaxID=151549 RepID=A0A4C1VE63_EUMVA|nr:hypothetical protein EVAR_23201_1 [Eumeta japonica]
MQSSHFFPARREFRRVIGHEPVGHRKITNPTNSDGRMSRRNGRANTWRGGLKPVIKEIVASQAERPIVPLYCSTLSLARSAQAEREIESCFFGLMMEPECKHRNSIMKQRILAVFGLVEIVLRCTLTMNDFQDLMMELEGVSFFSCRSATSAGADTAQNNAVNFDAVDDRSARAPPRRSAGMALAIIEDNRRRMFSLTALQRFLKGTPTSALLGGKRRVKVPGKNLNISFFFFSACFSAFPFAWKVFGISLLTDGKWIEMLRTR